MKTIKIAVLHFTFITAAVLLGGCVEAESIEDDETGEVMQELQSSWSWRVANESSNKCLVTVDYNNSAVNQVSCANVDQL